MSTTAGMDSNFVAGEEKPGLALARIREKRGLSVDYVAVKLHLRVKVVELLEADDYAKLPELVFIQGYIRAYTKLLGIPTEPYLQRLNQQHEVVVKPHRALIQRKRDSYIGERIMRWAAAGTVVLIVAVVGMWLQNEKDHKETLASTIKNGKKQVENRTANASDSQSKLTVISKMRSMFSSENEETEEKKESGR